MTYCAAICVERGLVFIRDSRTNAGADNLSLYAKLHTFGIEGERQFVLLSAGMAGVPCFSYTPQAVKQAVCGSGAAEKGQVQRMVGSLLSLPEPPEPDHAADALAVAICHANGAPMAAALEAVS